MYCKGETARPRARVCRFCRESKGRKSVMEWLAPLRIDLTKHRLVGDLEAWDSDDDEPDASRPGRRHRHTAPDGTARPNNGRIAALRQANARAVAVDGSGLSGGRSELRVRSLRGSKG
jgi:hypothetical protein